MRLIGEKEAEFQRALEEQAEQARSAVQAAVEAARADISESKQEVAAAKAQIAAAGEEQRRRVSALEAAFQRDVAELRSRVVEAEKEAAEKEAAFRQARNLPSPAKPAFSCKTCLDY